MVKITFITLFDQYSMGLRIMSSYLKEAGHACNIIYHKLPLNFREIHTPTRKPMLGEQFRDWQLRGYGYAEGETPWTPREVDILIDRLRHDKPDIIGFSTRSLLDTPSLPLLHRIKAEFPKTVLVAGGFGPFLSPSFYLDAVDFVAFGDGEETILDIANAVEADRPIRDIPNLIYKDNGHLIHNPVRPPTHSLEKYPLPDFDNPGICYIDDNALHKKDPLFIFDPDVDTYPMMIGRGCVGKCSYCSAGQWVKMYRDYGAVSVRPHRIRPIDHIIGELKLVKAKGFEYISFIESYLTGPKPFLMEFFKRYKKEIGLRFSAYLLYSQISENPDILDAACDAGLSKSPIGVQHGSERLCREFFNRKISNDLLLKIADMYHARKLKTEYQLIAGIPFETDETLDESFDFVSKLPMEYGYLHISRLKVFQNSPLDILMDERNIPKNCNVNEWYFNAMLYNFRVMFEDEFFEKIRSLTRRFLKKQAGSLPELLPQYYLMLIREFKKAQVSVFNEWPFIKKIYAAYAMSLQGQSVLIWGAGRWFSLNKEIFKSVSIDAIIDDDFTGGEYEGIPVKTSSYLHDRSLPVFICMDPKKAIHRKISETYPNISVIP